MDPTDISDYYRARKTIRKTDVYPEKIDLRYPLPENYSVPIDKLYRPLLSEKAKIRIFWVSILVLFIIVLQTRSGIFFL